jgi:hypothetical protein
VATLAATLPSTKAQAQVTGLLEPGTTLADISTRADDIRPPRANTGPWHSVNIPRDASGHNAQRDCGRGRGVSAIEQSPRLLQDTSNDRAVRHEGLKSLVHFVADLHQPPHAIGDERGGNDGIVQFNGRRTNLHPHWDVDLIELAYPGQVMLLE